VNDSQIVICGGYQYPNYFSSCMRLIDPINNASAVWQSDIPVMPISLYDHALVYFDGQLVVFGGETFDGRRVISVCYMSSRYIPNVYNFILAYANFQN
jgi:hypothetical protein